MKRLLFSLVIVGGWIASIVLLAGCGMFGGDSGGYVIRGQMRVKIDMSNHWEFLNITIVRVGDDIGSRLQIFSEVDGVQFENVIVTYSIIVGEAGVVNFRVVSLTQQGRGDTEICAQAFPRIVDVTGWAII